MDDFQFECRFYDDDATSLECCKKVTCGFIRHNAIYACPTYAVCALILWRFGFPILAKLIAALVALILLVAFGFPYINMRQMKKLTLRLNNGVVPECVVQFGEQIVLTEGAVRITTEYGQVTEIRRLERSCVLMTGRDSGIVFKPDSFTVGTYEDCLAFLKEKCTHLGEAAVYAKKRLRIRNIGGVMLGVLIGLFLGLSKAGVIVSLTLLPPWVWILAVLWLAASVFLLAAPKSVFK